MPIEAKLKRARSAFSILALMASVTCLAQAELQPFKTQTRLGTGVVDRELVGESATFDVGDGAVVAWTLATGAEKPTEIVHQWYFNDRLISSIPLSIKSTRFRTYSRQTVTDMSGRWIVKVADAGGRILETRSFVVGDRRLSPVARPEFPNQLPALSKPDLYRMVFSTSATETGEPASDLHELSMDGTTVYAAVKCQLPPQNKHAVGLRVFDGRGRNLADWKADMELTEACTITWPVRMNTQTDASGLWRFVYSVDNVEIEDYVKVWSHAAVNSSKDDVRITSLSPSDERPLQAGTTVRFLIETTTQLDPEKGSVGVLLQRGDGMNRYDDESLVSESQPVTKGRGRATFDFTAVIPDANSLTVVAPLIADGEQMARISDIRIYKIARSKPSPARAEAQVEQFHEDGPTLKTHSRLGAAVQNGALTGEANAFDVRRPTVVGWTAAEGLTKPVQIVHRWYFNGTLINEFPLRVTPEKPVATSRKTVTDMVGLWTLVVTGPGNSILESRDFVVTDKRLGSSAKADAAGNELWHVVFSTGINETDGPVNEVQEVPFSTAKVFMFVKGAFSPDRQKLTITVFDGNSQIAARDTREICLCDKTKQPYVHLGYPFNRRIDAPGLWHFVTSLGGQQIDGYLWVAPDEETASPAVNRLRIRNTWPRQEAPLFAGTTVQLAASVDYVNVERRSMIIFDVSTGDSASPVGGISLTCDIEPVTRGKGVVTFRKTVLVPAVETVGVSVKLRPADSSLRLVQDLRVFKVKR